MNVLTVELTGIITGLYTEAIPLAELGALSIQRLTSIEFHDPTQQWEVKDRAGALLFTHPSREQCLAWEHEHFNQ